MRISQFKNARLSDDGEAAFIDAVGSDGEDFTFEMDFEALQQMPAFGLLVLRKAEERRSKGVYSFKTAQIRVGDDRTSDQQLLLVTLEGSDQQLLFEIAPGGTRQIVDDIEASDNRRNLRPQGRPDN
jgi:hypothetical protein